MRSLSPRYELYHYISTRADYDPVKTFYVCAPEADACSYSAAEAFAERSGWKALAEEEGAVLVLPLAKNGWAGQPLTLLRDIYLDTKASFPSQNGRSLHGRGGFLWCWETLLYLIGYEEGAVFAGNALGACPNVFAAAALVNGVPDDLTHAEELSSHWLVKEVSGSYAARNRDIPVALWMLTEEPAALPAARYFAALNGAPEAPLEASFDSIAAKVWANDADPARQVRLSAGRFEAGPALTQAVYRHFLRRVIRWKNGPDGKLAVLTPAGELISSGRYLRRQAQAGGNTYGYYVHLPKGKTAAQCAGLPLVFSVHGRGEPAWMFTQKNGWEELADETGEFVLICPDSPGNIWFLSRDGEAFPEMVRRMKEEFAIDAERVYLTGFSNGAMITREAGTKYPQLFAGLSPWNGPAMPTANLNGAEETALCDGVYAQFPGSGWQMPYFVYLGDSDPAAARGSDGPTLGRMLAAGGCRAQPTGQDVPPFVPDEVYTGENHYTPHRGYAEGGRMTAYVYCAEEGVPVTAMTVMRDMPHGAVHDESRAAWEFLRRWRRPQNSKHVERVAAGRDAGHEDLGKGGTL